MPFLSTGKYVSHEEAKTEISIEHRFVETLYRVGRNRGLSDAEIDVHAAPRIERANMFEAALQ